MTDTFFIFLYIFILFANFIRHLFINLGFY